MVRERNLFSWRYIFNAHGATVMIYYKGNAIRGFGSHADVYHTSNKHRHETSYEENVEATISQLMSNPSACDEEKMKVIDASTYTFEIDIYPESDCPVIPRIQMWEQDVSVGKEIVNGQLKYLKVRFDLKGTAVITILSPDGEYFDSDEIDFSEI